MYKILTIITLGLVLGGCIYKQDIRQGNQVDQEAIAKVIPGMSRSQVRFVLGTPMVADPFHPDRWDYVYFYKNGKTGKTLQHRFEIYFADDVVTRVEDKQLKAGS